MDGTPPAFPPPSFDPPAPGPPAPATPVSVVVDEPPRRSRAGVLLAAGVLVIAALATGAFLLLRDSGGGTPTFSLTEATANAAATDQAAFTIEMSAMGTDVGIEAEIDKPAAVMHMTMDLGGDLFGGDAPIEILADLDGKVFYLHSAFFEQLGVTVDTEWISIDREAMERAGQDASVFDEFDIDNPLDAATIFDRAEKVEDKGFETIAGEKVRHYEVTLPTSALLEIDDTLQQQADQAGAALPDSVVYDVYVTEDNQLRRMRYSLDLTVSKVKVEVTFHTLTEPLSLELPADGDVTDVLDLL